MKIAREAIYKNARKALIIVKHNREAHYNHLDTPN